MNALAGIRILDLSRLLPGPYATQILTDLGAEVIKVERPPEGDYARALPPFVTLQAANGAHTVGATFAQINRGKQSLALDFSSPRGREILLRLAQTADVLLESFRPGVLARRGLDYATLRAHNPRLIYCSLSGYGQQGPYRERAGHDINYLAVAGILNLNGSQNNAPLPPVVQIADLAGGTFAALQILAALLERTRTGEGKFLDVALCDAAVQWMQPVIGAMYRAAGANPQRGALPLTGAYPCYNIYATSDDAYMSLGALEPNFWQKFCEALERAELVASQFDANAIPTVAAIFSARTRAEWVAFSQRVDCCLEPLLTVSETLAHPQTRARGFANPDPRRVPRLGEDTVEILRAVGCSDAETGQPPARS